MGLLFISLHVLGVVIYVVILRKSALAGVNPYALILVLQAASFAITLALLATGVLDYDLGQIGVGNIVTLIAGSIAVVTYMILSVVALKKMEAANFAIAFNLRLLLTTIFAAIFLSELPATLQIVGGVSIFGSILILSLKNLRSIDSSMLWGIATAITFSIHAIFEKHNVDTLGLGTHMLLALPLNILFLSGLSLLTKVGTAQYKEILLKDNVAVILARLLQGWMYVLAVTQFKVAIVNYASGLSLIAIAIASALFLNEKTDLRRKTAATGVSLLGLTCILTGS